jgi:hypothetical protein
MQPKRRRPRLPMLQPRVPVIGTPLEEMQKRNRKKGRISNATLPGSDAEAGQKRDEDPQAQ